jgi:hypothetical protein
MGTDTVSDIHEHFCPFCGHWMGEGSALCSVCRTPMCKNCVASSPTPPDDPDLDEREVLIYRPAYRKWPDKCVNCRETYAVRELEAYWTWDDPPYDPSEWVAFFTARSFEVDLPEVEDHYGLAEGFARFASAIGLPVADVAVRNTESETVTGWLVTNGIKRHWLYNDSWNGLSSWTSTDYHALVFPDGRWLAAYEHQGAHITWFTDLVRGRQVVAPGRGAPDTFALVPEAFLALARDLSRPTG